MRRCFVCNSFITLSEVCCVRQKHKWHKLELSPLLLGWDIHVFWAVGILVQIFPLSLFASRVRTSESVWLCRHFSSTDEFSCIRLTCVGKHLVAGRLLFSSLSLNSLSRIDCHAGQTFLVHRADLTSPDKSSLTIIFTDFIQEDWINWKAAHWQLKRIRLASYACCLCASLCASPHLQRYSPYEEFCNVGGSTDGNSRSH